MMEMQVYAFLACCIGNVGSPELESGAVNAALNWYALD